MGEERRRGSFEERVDAAIKRQEEVMQKYETSRPHIGTSVHSPAAMMLMMAAAIGGTWADKYPRPSRRSRRGY